MAPILYMTELSPPVRGVLMAAKAIGIDFERKEINMMTGDHLTEAYLKVSSFHQFIKATKSNF